MSIDLNAVYRASLGVTDASGSAVDASTITLVITRPDQTVNSYTYAGSSVTRLALGSYYVDIAVNQEGLWKFVWSTTVPTSSEISYENVTDYRSIVSLEDMRNYLHLVSTAQDELLRGFMSDATELIEKHIGTCVIRTFTDDFIAGPPGIYRNALRLPHGPCPTIDSVTSVTSVMDGGPSWDADQLIVNPDSGIVDAKDFMGFWFGPWKATYVGGRAIIPNRIILACKIIVDDLWAQHRETTTDPLTPNYEDEMMMAERMPANYEMPARAWNLIKREARPGFA